MKPKQYRPLFAQSVLALAALASLSAFAQVAPAPQATMASSNPSFAIRGFNIKGENPLSAAQTSSVLAPFLRTDATIDTLQKATSTLEAALRDAGFGLHKVSLPPQEVGDTVTLEIVKFTIGRVVVTGNQHFGEANIRNSLPELKEGNSPNFKRLAVQTALANENSSKQINVALKEANEADKIDATVQVRDIRPWFAAVTLSNNGNDSSGKDRFTVSAGHNNLWNSDHQAVLAYTTSLERTGDVRQWGLNYKIPFYSARGTLGFSATQSDVLGTFATFTSTGVGHTRGLNYTISNEPEGGRRSYFSVSLDDRVYGAALVNGVTVGVDRRSRPLGVGYSVKNESDGSVWAYNLDLSLNIGSGSGNNLTAYRSEFNGLVAGQGISSRAFKILRAGHQYSASLGKTWLWSVRSQAQLSNTALISGEQIGLGGTGSLRGAPDRAISGDAGLLSSLEITSPELIKGLRLTSFLDSGWLSNRSADGFRRVSSDNLASLGLGLRFGHQSGVSLSADYGRLLNSSKLPLTSNSSAPQKGDDKLHLTMSVRF
ncbi:ShlB/FhaC/HecB family hemolysin secretion/activation protein [Variovorax sp. PCZ-1]|uniref:ShlB/FhaC/HecB family hemolysin secretion/activation protein n=1 Tax=Variovorax sp. PCZ-1 TaxID=2835533 RepID=UPI001BD104E2|nr:ShlB/FhaC/HecB family hemolysin secretion/activation protein [Variovorax sp. PCZ-1]